MTGKIKSLKQDKGYGFIKPDQPGKDVFFHVSGLGDCEFDALTVGQEVTFDTEDTEKGTRAVRVCIP